MTGSSGKQALEGVRILDFTQMMLGPLCTQTLADLGADVIKIERPGKGEWMRGMPMLGEFVGKDSAAFHAFNRNKRSVTVNIKNEQGRGILLEMVKDFDVIAENFRAGVMDRLGLGYEDFRAVKPDIIYASGSGWGQSSELAKQNMPGQDLLIQAMSGVMYNTGRSTEQPTACGTPIADFAASQAMATGILAALIARGRHGIGQRVEVDLYSATLNLMAQENFAVVNQNLSLERSESGLATPWNSVPYGPHPTSDGYVAIAMCPLEKFAALLGDPKIHELHEFNDRDELKRLVDNHTAKYTSDDLLALLREADVWCSPIRTSRQAMDELLGEDSDFLVTMQHSEAGEIKAIANPITLTGTPVSRAEAPPMVGEHTDEVLVEMFGQVRVDVLRAAGAI